jgi:hypothetical protein
MKDAFGNKLTAGMKVIYSTGGSGGTVYVIGHIVQLIPHKNDPNKSYCPPDRVEIAPEKTTRCIKFAKNPIIYASNVVKWESKK